VRSALVVLVAVLVACQPTPSPVRSLDPNADVVVPYAVSGGGEVRFTVHPRYTVGGPVTVTLDIRAGTLEIRGPLAGSVLASQMESGEQLVRALTPDDIHGTSVRPGQRDHIQVTWDGRNDKGEFVPAETYSLSLFFIVGDAPQRFGTVIEMKAR
jgi:hypothetical protein